MEPSGGPAVKGPRNGHWNDIPHYLFLIEFFVYHINSDRLQNLNDMFCAPTSIFFSFPNIDDDFQEVKATDESFAPFKKALGEIECVNSGRSMLFALSKKTCDEPKPQEFLICLHLEKHEQNNLNVEVASGALDFSDQFSAIQIHAKECWHRHALPEAEVFEGNVPLKYQNAPAGYVKLYFRLSALGETIVTDFGSPAEDSNSTYMFKSDLVRFSTYYFRFKFPRKSMFEIFLMFSVIV